MICYARFSLLAEKCGLQTAEVASVQIPLHPVLPQVWAGKKRAFRRDALVEEAVKRVLEFLFMFTSLLKEKNQIVT